MWKYLGVAGLWVVLISAPHLQVPGLAVTVAGVVPGVPGLPPPTEDPGDPFRQQPPSDKEAGSAATIHFKNDLDKAVNLVGAIFSLDGKPLEEVPALARGQDMVLFSGRIAPGMHLLKTELQCQGNRRGPFTYMQAYRFNLASEQVLTVPEQRAVKFTVSVNRHKGMNVPFDKQIDISVKTEEQPQPGPQSSIGAPPTPTPVLTN